MINIKYIYTTLMSIVPAVLTTLFGEVDKTFTSLMCFMFVDIVLGVFIAFFNKSTKSEFGGLSSNTFFKGILKKTTILLVIIFANRIDILLGVDYVKNIVIYTYIFNECISIIENVGLLGIPIPKKLRDVLDLIKGEVG